MRRAAKVLMHVMHVMCVKEACRAFVYYSPQHQRQSEQEQTDTTMFC